MTDEIAGKNLLVTGAGRGIGKRLALGFAAKGARVGLLARSKAELNAAKLELEHAGGNALAIEADVRVYEEVSVAADRMKARFGGIDILICAAAIHGPIGPFVDAAPKAWAEAIDTNLTGVAHAVHVSLPGMIAKRSGKIVLLSGGGAAYGRANFSAYAASKAGLVRFAETVAAEVADHNVQINVLGPGGSYTHLTDEIIGAGDLAGQAEVDEARKIRVTGGIPPERQMELALFLASPRSNHITGRFVHVKDSLKKLEREAMHNPDLYTLRRMTKL